MVDSTIEYDSLNVMYTHENILRYIQHSQNRLEDIKVQLTWLKALQDQVIFLNKQDILPDFEIVFRIRPRRSD